MSDLLKMIKTQNRVNTTTNGADWVKLNLNWRRAAMQEAAEAVDSFPWKWWKGGDTNVLNAKIEIVDIWHFVMSMMIEEEVRIDDMYEAKLTALTMTPTAILPEDQDVLLSHIERVTEACATKKSAAEIADTLFLAAGKLGMTFDEIKRMYYGKAVLNLFRQSHGYADKTYVKIWNGKEDNMVMMELIDNMTYSEGFDEELSSLLGERYMLV